MFIVKLIGGLGNQIFQFCFSKYLEHKTNEKVFFDLEWFEKSNRACLLKNYIEIPEITKHEIDDHIYNKGKAAYILNKLGVYKYPKPFTYTDDDVVMLKSKKFSRKETHYFVGFWAYKDFIHPFIPEVREILRYRSKNEKYELFKHKICSYLNSASIHVRRTDYLESQHIFNMLDTTYYNKSINYLNKKYNDIKYFLFTDDPVWCKDIFDDMQNVELVSGCGFSDIEEFELMRHCSHNIIANSTFSWWAACLNDNHNKTIILPEKWFVNLEFQDVYVKGVSALRLNNGVYF